MLKKSCVLYYRGSVKNPGPLREVITTVERVQEILRHNYSVPMGGHSGVTATLKKLTKHYWWNGIQRYIEAFISTCEACQCFEKLKTQAPTLKQIVVVEPLGLVGIDLIGPLPLTNQGHRYVLTMTDYFIKWVDMYPLATKEPKESAQQSRLLSLNSGYRLTEDSEANEGGGTDPLQVRVAYCQLKSVRGRDSIQPTIGDACAF